METNNVIINDLKTMREIEKKLEQEHIESMKQVNEEIQKMLEKKLLKTNSLSGYSNQ